MDLSCESVTSPEDRRPTSCKFVDLHVLYVPDDQWNVKLNKVPSEAIESFISAGFIRVDPDTTLKALRSELGVLLGAERSVDKFSFLRCVGRSLALVKNKQEKDLKVKTFAPPYAAQPELYLLPAVENESSVYSQSLSPETSSSSSDHRTYYPTKTWGLSAETKEPVKFPLIPLCSHPPPPTPSLDEEEEEEGDDDEESSSSSEAEDRCEEDTSINAPGWRDNLCCSRKEQNHRTTNPVSHNKVKAFQPCEDASAQETELLKEEESRRRTKVCDRKSRAATDSGAVESAEDRDSIFSPTDRLRKSQDAQRNEAASGATQSPAVLSRPGRCTSPPPVLDPPAASHKSTAPPGFQTNREGLIGELQLVRGERKQLEWKRQELLRKGKDLLAQNRHRRNQARDCWKKKYFDTKKTTAPLEDTLRNLRQQLESFYNKLLHQLHARDNRSTSRRRGPTSIKNELIIQIMTESHEVDNLKRKVEDAKMKLATEVKLRKQAATELRALKAELAQKKSQASHSGPNAPLGVGKPTRERPKVQSSSV